MKTPFSYKNIKKKHNSVSTIFHILKQQKKERKLFQSNLKVKIKDKYYLNSCANHED
jgi:hypothetical protein